MVNRVVLPILLAVTPKPQIHQLQRPRLVLVLLKVADAEARILIYLISFGLGLVVEHFDEGLEPQVSAAAWYEAHRFLDDALQLVVDVLLVVEDVQEDGKLLGDVEPECFH